MLQRGRALWGAEMPLAKIPGAAKIFGFNGAAPCGARKSKI